MQAVEVCVGANIAEAGMRWPQQKKGSPHLYQAHAHPPHSFHTLANSTFPSTRTRMPTALSQGL